MIGVIITLALVGVILYLVNTLPMDGTIKNLIWIVVVVCVVLWLLNIFGVMSYDIPIPRLH